MYIYRIHSSNIEKHRSSHLSTHLFHQLEFHERIVLQCPKISTECLELSLCLYNDIIWSNYENDHDKNFLFFFLFIYIINIVPLPYLPSVSFLASCCPSPLSLRECSQSTYCFTPLASLFIRPKNIFCNLWLGIKFYLKDMKFCNFLAQSNMLVRHLRISTYLRTRYYSVIFTISLFCQWRGLNLEP